MDALQMEQVLLTLAANAWEAMAASATSSETIGGGQLRIATAAALPPETRVQLVVTDTGRGMDEVALAHLFDPLYGNWEEGGLGLGLAWAREIVEQAGGRIDVESRPGEGSTFRILVPTVEPTGAAARGPLADSRDLAPDHLGAETVLLVEDEGDLRRPLAEILENRGYLVLSAASGAEALDLANRHAGPIHLLVTDVVMPGMSGQELARLLTPLRTETKVIFTTGYPEDVVAEESLLGDGPYHFLKKPFSSQALMSLMREVLREG
jgi:CheY-like chemotaxis protein